MEALLEKEGTVESWNDERMDELSRRMDKGFEKTATKEEMNLRFAEVNRRFGEVDKRFDSIDARLLQINNHLDRINNTLVLAAFGVIAALIANGFFG
jgi:organic radical activating enzyme